MATDRLLDVADIIVARLRVVWQPGEPDEVSREYGIEEDVDAGDFTKLHGRKLRVFPMGDGEVERLDRATVLWEYRFALVGYEHYKDSPGLPPAKWMDDRVKWGREVVFDTLNIDKVADYLGTPATLYTQSIDRPLAYDFDIYRECSAFWTGFELVMREVRSG